MIDPRSVLQYSKIYTIFRSAVSSEDTARAFVNEYVCPRPHDRILDIGCGPGVMLRHLPVEHYTGIDPEPRYIDEARRLYGDRAQFVLGTARTVALDAPGTFDIAMSIGVLHHLDDDEALDLLRFARAALGPGGRMITLDCGFAPDQSAAARLIIKMDRGRHVRTTGQYERLVTTVFPKTSVVVRHDLLRIPYTHVICQAAV